MSREYVSPLFNPIFSYALATSCLIAIFPSRQKDQLVEIMSTLSMFDGTSFRGVSPAR